MVKGQTPEQICQMFSIVRKFTPEVEENIGKQHAWIGKH
jgi:hypothetical protein